MAHQVVWEKVSVTEVGATEDTIVHRGGMLPESVDDFTRFALVGAGAVKFVPQEAPDVALTRALETPEPVRLPEHPADLPRTDVGAVDLATAGGLELPVADKPADEPAKADDKPARTTRK